MTSLSPNVPDTTFQPTRARILTSTGWVATITVGAIAAALMIGAGLAASTALTTAVVLALVATALLVSIPVRYMAVIMLLVTATAPSVILAHPSGLSLVLGGTLKAIGIFAGVTLLKAALQQRIWLRPPGIGMLIVGLSIFAIATSAIVASFATYAPPALVSDVLRALALILAGIIGFLSITSAQSKTERASIYRWMTLSTILIAVSGLAYWAWLKNILPAPPGLRSVFSTLRTTSKFTSGGRANFPYVSDAPNLDAVAYVLTAAFVTPALAANSSR